MLYMFASAKGSPGTTTLAGGVAARWPLAIAPLLVEADPHGGDLAARFRLRPAPGLVSAATDTRLITEPHRIGEHLQPLPPAEVPVLLAPAQFGPAAIAVRAVCDLGILPILAADRPVVVDAGAAVPGSPALPLAAPAALVIVVTRDRIDDLVHTAAAVELLREHGATDVGLAIRRTGGLGIGEISREFGLPVLADIPTDALGAAVLSGRAGGARGWWRLRLPRAAAGLAHILATRPHDPQTGLAQPTGVAA